MAEVSEGVILKRAQDYFRDALSRSLELAFLLPDDSVTDIDFEISGGATRSRHAESARGQRKGRRDEKIGPRRATRSVFAGAVVHDFQVAGLHRSQIGKLSPQAWTACHSRRLLLGAAYRALFRNATRGNHSAPKI